MTGYIYIICVLKVRLCNIWRYLVKPGDLLASELSISLATSFFLLSLLP